MTSTVETENGTVTAPRIRVHQLARRLGVSTAAVMERAKAVDVDAHSPLQGLDTESVRLILEDFQRAGTGEIGATPRPWVIHRLLRDVTPVADDPVGETSSDDALSGEATVETLEPELPLDEDIVVEDVVDEEPMAQDLVGEEVAAEESPVEDALEEEPPMEDVVIEDLLVEQPPVEDVVIEDLLVEQPLVVETPVEELPVDQPLVDDDLFEDLLVERPPVEDVVIEDLLGEQPSVAEPPVEESPVEEESGVETSAVGTTMPRRQKRILRTAVLIVIGTTILTLAFALLRPVNGAESQVVVRLSGTGEEARELQSFNVMASSQTVLTPVAEQFGMTVSELRDVFTTELVDDSAVIRLTVTDPDSEQARSINEAITDSFLTVANEPVDQAQIDFVDEQIADTRERLDEIAGQTQELEAAEAVTEASRLRIETDQAMAQSRLASLESTLLALTAGGTATAGSISTIQTQIDQTNAVLDALLEELQSLDSPGVVAARSELARLAAEADTLRALLADLEASKVELGLDQVGSAQARLLTPAHVVEGPLGLTPTRAVILGVLVGGLIAAAWVVVATQLAVRR